MREDFSGCQQITAICTNNSTSPSSSTNSSNCSSPNGSQINRKTSRGIPPAVLAVQKGNTSSSNPNISKTLNSSFITNKKVTLKEPGNTSGVQGQGSGSFTISPGTVAAAAVAGSSTRISNNNTAIIPKKKTCANGNSCSIPTITISNSDNNTNNNNSASGNSANLNITSSNINNSTNNLQVPSPILPRLTVTSTNIVAAVENSNGTRRNSSPGKSTNQNLPLSPTGNSTQSRLMSKFSKLFWYLINIRLFQRFL